jgi:N-acetylmuramic acid 6-phosphate etherase
MSNLQARNVKLRDRAERILQGELNLDQHAARTALADAGGDLRIALVMNKSGAARDQATEALQQANWKVDEAVSILRND